LFQTFSTGLGWNALDTITSEIFPTSVRSTAVGVCNAYGRIGPIVAQIVNTALVRKPVILLFVSGAMLLVATAATLVLKDEDMSGQHLDDHEGELHVHVTNSDRDLEKPHLLPPPGTVAAIDQISVTIANADTVIGSHEQH
jgi:MFS family permease